MLNVPADRKNSDIFSFIKKYVHNPQRKVHSFFSRELFLQPGARGQLVCREYGTIGIIGRGFVTRDQISVAIGGGPLCYWLLDCFSSWIVISLINVFILWNMMMGTKIRKV